MHNSKWYKLGSNKTWFKRLADIAAAMFLARPLATTVEVTDISELKSLVGSLQADSEVMRIKEQQIKSCPADVILPKELFLTRPLPFSARREKDLRAMAELDLFRRTPFRPDEVSWAVSRRPGYLSGALQYVIRQSQLRLMERAFDLSGVTVRGFLLREGDKLVPIPFQSEQLSVSGRQTILLNGILGLASIAMFMFAIGYPIFLAERETNELNAKLAVLRSEATDLRSRLSNIEAETQTLSVLGDALLHRWSPLSDLATATDLLPDTAWVSDAKFLPDSISLTGQIDGNAASLVLQLSENEHGLRPSIDGAVARTATNEELFTLTLGRVK